MNKRGVTKMDRYKITLEGRGGELDCRTVAAEEEITAAVRDIALNSEFCPGDTIRIIEMQPE